MHVYTSNFDWFTRLSVSFVTGWSHYFGVGFTTQLKTAQDCENHADKFNAMTMTKLNLLFFLKFLGYGSVSHCLCSFSEKKKRVFLGDVSSKVGNHRFSVKRFAPYDEDYLTYFT